MTLLTHALFDGDTFVGEVLPDALNVYPEEDLVALPADYWAEGQLYTWDGRTPVENLPALRDARWQAVKARRDELQRVIATEWGVFDADVESRTNILGKIASLREQGDDAPAEVTWKLHTNDYATLTREDFIKAGVAVASGVEAIYAASFAIEAALAAADSSAAIAAIDVDSGWPS